MGSIGIALLSEGTGAVVYARAACERIPVVVMMIDSIH